VKTSIEVLGFSIAEVELHCSQIQSVLSTNLLSDEYLERWKDGSPITFGHCYAATEALWYLWGRKNHFFPNRVKWTDKNGLENVHWYLRRKSDGEIVDPTMMQFEEYPPYRLGKPIIFPSFPKKSKRCKEILRRIKAL
jgi:hypothetical protein